MNLPESLEISPPFFPFISIIPGLPGKQIAPTLLPILHPYKIKPVISTGSLKKQTAAENFSPPGSQDFLSSSHPPSLPPSRLSPPFHSSHDCPVCCICFQLPVSAPGFLDRNVSSSLHTQENPHSHLAFQRAPTVASGASICMARSGVEFSSRLPLRPGR